MSTIINGTSGSDSILIEGNEAHEIHGLDGDDSIFVATNSNTGYYWGGWGNDTLDGGAGNDWIRDTLGSNIYTGGTGQDTLYGGDGDDTYLFSAGDGVDQITDSSDSNAFIFTGVASTTVQVIKTIEGHLVLNYGASDQITVLNCFDGSGSKIDSLQFSDGIWSEIDLLDRLLTYGSSGADTLTGYQEARNRLYGYAGLDSLYGGPLADTLLGGADADHLYGGEGDDTLLGEAGHDTLNGDAGDDTLDGGSGNDELNDSGGNDTYRFSVGSGVDRINDYDGDTGYSDVVEFSDVASTALTAIERVDGHLVLSYGSADQLTVVGYFNDANARIESFKFSDGVTWNDAAIKARVITQGDAGPDSITGYDDGGNRIYGYDGLDYLVGGALADTLSGGNDADTLYGQAGADSLLGGADDDWLYGGTGNDTFNGGTGNDTFNGEAGNDTYQLSVGSGSDRIEDADSTVGNSDVVIFADVTSTSLTATERINDDLVLRYGSDDQLTVANYFGDTSNRIESFKFSDAITWNDAAIKARVITQGDAGTNTINGYDNGSNRIYGYEGMDNLTGGALADTIVGGDDADYIVGLTGADSLQGDAGEDSLYGGSGNDTLNGGSGDDTLNGEAGNDTYQLRVGSGSDRIEDYDSTVGNSDVVIFSDVASSGLTAIERIDSDLVLRYGDSDQLTVANYFNDFYRRIESFKFSDAITWNDAAIKARVITQGNSEANQINGYDDGGNRIYGYEGTDNLTGGALADTLVGGDDADTLFGQAGADSLQGDAGEDSLYGGSGNDTCNGGAGNDTLSGDTGNDTYQLRVGSGSDRIEDADSTVGNSDVVIFADVTSSGLTAVERINGDLVLRYGSDDQLTVANYFGDNSARIESFKFSDAATWNDAAIKTRVITQGDASANYIVGYDDGSNRIYGYEGMDNLTGGALADTIVGGDDADYLYGQAGADSLQGDAGEDTISAGAGNDQLYGGADNDSLGAGEGNDTLDGGSGNDTLNGEAGNDTYQLSLGSGTDRIEDYDNTAGNSDVIQFTNVTSTALTALERIGSDLVLRYGSSDQLSVVGYFGDANARIESFKFSDAVTWNDAAIKARVQTKGDSTANTISGYDDGSNRVYGLAGNDTLYGGAQADTLSGGDDADWLYGNQGNDSLLGDAGNDTLYGHEGNDTLNGGTGNDSMVGDEGDDTYYVNSSSDKVIETDASLSTGGTDLVLSTLSSYTLAANVENGRIAATGNANLSGNSLGNILYAGAGNNVLNGGSGSDTASYAYASSAVQVSLALTTAQATGGSGNDTLIAIEHLSGSNYNDTLLGNTGNNQLSGGSGNDNLLADSGNDTLDGGSGADGMTGGDGSDTYVVDHIGDKVIETNADASLGGTDLVLSALASYALSANVENGRITTSNTAQLTGNLLDNLLYAGAGANVLNGSTGTDTVSYLYASAGISANLSLTTAQSTGGSGSDTLIAIENLTGSNFNDRLTGGTGANRLDGGLGIDTLSGGSGNDTLLGGAGNDTLVGGAGKDSLTGGAGNDIFDFNALSELGLGAANRDVITDFVAGQDRIDLSTIDANTALAGDQAFTLVSSFTTTAGQVRYAGGILYLNTDNDTAAEYEIQLTGTIPTTLTGANLVL